MTPGLASEKKGGQIKDNSRGMKDWRVFKKGGLKAERKGT